LEDDDGVIRRLPLYFRSRDLKKGERTEPSMALEIASRVTGTKADFGDANGVKFNGRAIRYSGPGPLLNFDGGAGWIPSYSLADLHSCALQGKKDYFRQHFAGKAVFLGAVLDIEDRKLTSRRFIGTPDGARLPDRCVHAPMKGLYRTDIVRDSIPGVFLQASGVNMLVRNEMIGELGKTGRIAIALILSCVAAIAAFVFAPVPAATAIFAGALAWVAAATAAFQAGFSSPVLHPIAAVILSFGAIVAFRFAIADKDKRYLRQAFSLYLPATVVDRLVKSAAPPTLGGETRTLTVLFSDIQGFTQISERLSPPDLVQFLNRYLSVMTDIIEAHGGFVDKYIGDAVIGVFGAPVNDPDHARHAVEAALVCQQRLAEMQESFGLPGAPQVKTRIGINTGEMLVGNIGSPRRFNYTVMGDAVNLASRLEGANTIFGTSILVSDSTWQSCHDRVAFREIDSVRVVGRKTPVTIYEPQETPTDRASAEIYAAALTDYRTGRLGSAKKAFGSLAEAGDVVAQRFAERISAMGNDAPPSWDGVTDLDTK
jgi:class 3 adenylate cyclase